LKWGSDSRNFLRWPAIAPSLRRWLREMAEIHGISRKPEQTVARLWNLRVLSRFDLRFGLVRSSMDDFSMTEGAGMVVATFKAKS